MKFNRLKLILKKIFELIRFFFNLKDLIEDIKVNQGIILTFNNLTRTSNDIKEYEFKIFSQGGEDGILQHLPTWSRCVDTHRGQLLRLDLHQLICA